MKNQAKNILLLTLLLVNGPVFAKCGPQQLETAESLAAQASAINDLNERALLLREALQLCARFDWWMSLGKTQGMLNNWLDAVDAFAYARDFHEPNERGELSAVKISQKATANSMLAEAYWEAGNSAYALSAVEEAKIQFEVIKRPIPPSLLQLQAKIDDSLAVSDAGTLARSIEIQRSRSSRGIGLRPKIETTTGNKENTSVDTAASVDITNMTDSADDNAVPVTFTETPSPPAANHVAPVPSQTAEAKINIQVLFDFDSDNLASEGLQSVEQMARAIEQLNLNESSVILLIGHTDSKGAEQYNQNLSERRARAVLKKLSESASIRARIKAEGRGESELRYPGDTRDVHRRNRRVELVIRN
jgi:outer membrane protein OmpA-like peptidoglycan-associated protein